MPRGTKRSSTAGSTREKVIILGAAGRDFHNFNCVFRNNESVEVVAFTATQIPKIDERVYPSILAGHLYPNGIPIVPESQLEEMIKKHSVTRCILAYSDLPHTWVGNRAARCLAAGADFELLSHRDTMVTSSKPVIAITAIRTGCGKSQTTRYIAAALKKLGKKPVVCRHPMPYGDLSKMIVQRFEKYEDCDKHHITIEEREEYEQHIKEGTVVYAGVDYEKILREAEKEADVVIWDGGNNDLPFFKPDLWFVVADPHRQGHEMSYYPGDVNFRAADCIVINKVNTAPKGTVEKIRENAKIANPNAIIIETNSEVTADRPELIKGKRVVIVEDGPTLTHGEMKYGAGQVAADKYGAGEIVDPRSHAVGSMRELYTKFSHLGRLIPAMGYYDQQIKELQETINNTPADSVILATPMDLSKLIKVNKPCSVVSYASSDHGDVTITQQIEEFVMTDRKSVV